MASQGSVRRSGLPRTSYYAPNFRVEVEGLELDPTSKGDVLDLKVTMDKENLTSFDLTVNNWDDRTLDFKYSDGKTFEPGNRVVIYMGYADDLKFMAAGQVTALTPRFPESGPPTLGVTGVDAMVRLRDRKPAEGEVKQWVNKTDAQIAREVAKRNGLEPHVEEGGPTHALVVQKNQDDAQFLTERAKRIDFDCFVHMDPVTLKDTLHFVRPRDGRQGTRATVYVFTWGENLISFDPRLSIGRQVGRVTVRGWDPASKRPIVYTADPERDLPKAEGTGPAAANGPQVVRERMNDKQEVVVDQPVNSLQEARELAMSLLRERAYDYLTGSGQVIGLPDLRPADNLELRGLGTRFSGTYHVTKVVHTLGSSGFLTQFDVRRLTDGGARAGAPGAAGPVADGDALALEGASL